MLVWERRLQCQQFPPLLDLLYDEHCQISEGVETGDHKGLEIGVDTQFFVFSVGYQVLETGVPLFNQGLDFSGHVHVSKEKVEMLLQELKVLMRVVKEVGVEDVSVLFGDLELSPH